MNMNYEKYKDIINLPHHVSNKHPQMSIDSRSAQFAPFAALTGYEDEVKETARLTEDKIELDEELKEILDKKIYLLKKQIKNNPEVVITYFVPDKKKEGGKYQTVAGKVKKIDDFNKNIILIDGVKLSIKEIIEIYGETLNIEK